MQILYPVCEKDQSGTVTAMVHCLVSARERNRFTSLLREHLSTFDAREGVLGSQLFEEETGGRFRLTVVQRFATAADHEAWLRSEAFTRWEQTVAPAQVPVEAVHRYYGLETLFTPATEDSPPQWKMAVVLTLAAFPCSYGLSAWFGETLAKTSPLVGALITSPIMVGIMTYIMVPLLTRLFHGWLQPGAAVDTEANVA